MDHIFCDIFHVISFWRGHLTAPFTLFLCLIRTLFLIHFKAGRFILSANLRHFITVFIHFLIMMLRRKGFKADLTIFRYIKEVPPWVLSKIIRKKVSSHVVNHRKTFILDEGVFLICRKGLWEIPTHIYLYIIWLQFYEFLSKPPSEYYRYYFQEPKYHIFSMISYTKFDFKPESINLR